MLIKLSILRIFLKLFLLEVFRRKKFLFILIIYNNLMKWSMQKSLTICAEKFEDFSGKFSDFCRTICRFLQENLTVFTGTFDNSFRKIWLFFKENLPIFLRKSEDFCKKIRQSLHLRLTIFLENLMTFAGKSGDFCRKILMIIVGKIHNFCRKI